jgi:hypothetical protein
LKQLLLHAVNNIANKLYVTAQIAHRTINPVYAYVGAYAPRSRNVRHFNSRQSTAALLLRVKLEKVNKIKIKPKVLFALGGMVKNA